MGLARSLAYAKREGRGPCRLELTRSAGPRTAFSASVFSPAASTRRESTLAPRWILHRGGDEQMVGAE
jgi:hypothetical protein